MIGKTLAITLYKISMKYHLDISLILLVRDINRLDKFLKELLNNNQIECIIGDIKEPIKYDSGIDYIIHAASITDSKMMIEKPVEVIYTNIIGTKNILELANNKKTISVVYLSSMEVYGFTTEDHLLTEEDVQYLNPLSLRSSYPESKRMCENLCIAYKNEYSIPVKILRLAQTFGKGVKKNDTRVFAQFARAVTENKNIQLSTDGLSERMYLDVEDCISAIILVLLNGQNGSAYNVGNKETFCSIKEMAEFVAGEIANGDIEIEMKKDSDTSKFSPKHKLYLDTSKIEALGWKPAKNLKDMYFEMIKEWNDENSIL